MRGSPVTGFLVALYLPKSIARPRTSAHLGVPRQREAHVIRQAALLASFLLVMACTGVEVVPVRPSPLPAKAPDQVEVLLSEPEDREYEEIGLIHVDRKAFNDGLRDQEKLVREAAARLGADAVILTVVQQTQGTGVLVTTNPVLIAKAIVWKKQPGPNRL